MTAKNNNFKDTGSSRTSNDASTPIVNHNTVGRNSSKNEEKNISSSDTSGTDKGGYYVSGDEARSSSSHQFHKS